LKIWSRHYSFFYRETIEKPKEEKMLTNQIQDSRVDYV